MLKVIFGFCFLAIIVIFNWIIITNGIKQIDNNKTTIHCTRGDGRAFSAKQAGITLSDYQLKNGFDYKDFFEGYNEYEIRAIYEKCYDADRSLDIFALQRVYEIRGDKKELSEADRAYIDSEIKNITSGYKTDSQKSSYLDYSVKLFDIKPVYSYTEFIKYFLLGNIIIYFVFEVLRRIFYYIILGEIRPRAKK